MSSNSPTSYTPENIQEFVESGQFSGKDFRLETVESQAAITFNDKNIMLKTLIKGMVRHQISATPANARECLASLADGKSWEDAQQVQGVHLPQRSFLDNIGKFIDAEYKDPEDDEPHLGLEEDYPKDYPEDYL